jgi:hypothetical protein
LVPGTFSCPVFINLVLYNGTRVRNPDTDPNFACAAKTLLSKIGGEMIDVQSNKIDQRILDKLFPEGQDKYISQLYIMDHGSGVGGQSCGNANAFDENEIKQLCDNMSIGSTVNLMGCNSGQSRRSLYWAVYVSTTTRLQTILQRHYGNVQAITLRRQVGMFTRKMKLAIGTACLLLLAAVLLKPIYVQYTERQTLLKQLMAARAANVCVPSAPEEGVSVDAGAILDLIDAIKLKAGRPWPPATAVANAGSSLEISTDSGVLMRITSGSIFSIRVADNGAKVRWIWSTDAESLHRAMVLTGVEWPHLTELRKGTDPTMFGKTNDKQ